MNVGLAPLWRTVLVVSIFWVLSGTPLHGAVATQGDRLGRQQLPSDKRSARINECSGGFGKRRKLLSGARREWQAHTLGPVGRSACVVDRC